MNIPKVIWFFWAQGYDTMPHLIRTCYQSWEKHNTDWKIIFLTSENLDQYLNATVLEILDRDNINIQAKSDIIRINLLKNHGGVWTDSTCYCCRPINEWLPEYFDTGFFAFSNPTKKYTMISSWFLASQKDQYITNKFCESTNKYWLDSPKLHYWGKKTLVRYAFKILQLPKFLSKRPQLWFHPIFTKQLNFYPYFWFHYLFERSYLADIEFRKQWDATPKISSDIPHRLQHYGLYKEVSETLRNEIDQKKAPLYKLNWRIESERSPVLKTLFQGKAAHS